MPEFHEPVPESVNLASRVFNVSIVCNDSRGLGFFQFYVFLKLYELFGFFWRNAFSHGKSFSLNVSGNIDHNNKIKTMLKVDLEKKRHIENYDAIRVLLAGIFPSGIHF